MSTSRRAFFTRTLGVLAGAVACQAAAREPETVESLMRPEITRGITAGAWFEAEWPNGDPLLTNPDGTERQWNQPIVFPTPLPVGRIRLELFDPAGNLRVFELRGNTLHPVI